MLDQNNEDQTISNHLHMKHGLPKPLSINAIDVMIEEGKIYNQKQQLVRMHFSYQRELNQKTGQMNSVKALYLEEMMKIYTTTSTSALMECLMVVQPGLVVRSYILLEATKIQFA